MTTIETYKTDTWEVAVHWGREIDGEGDQDTEVYVQANGPLGLDDAIALGRHLTEKLEGDDE